MPTFRYRAYGAQGELAEGSIEAISQDAASDTLWTQGLVPFQMRSVGRSGQRWWQRDLFGGTRPKDLASFTREFATLMAAEIPLDDALRIVSEQQATPHMRSVVSGLLADVLNGATLSDAIQKHPKVFPSDYVSVVRAGEIGGTLGQVLEELADLLDRRMEIRARIQSSLIYPAVLIVLTLVSLGIIVGGLVPSIAPIFAQGGKPMPPGIRFLVAMHASSLEIMVILLSVASVLAIVAFHLHRHQHTRIAFDRLKLKIPIVGAVMLHQDIARFARTLGTLLKSGVPLVQASSSARNVISNYHIAAGLDRAIESIREGVALHQALISETPFPALALRMISVGEEAGKLDRMLIRLAMMFEQQTQRSIERVVTMLTPALTVVIAVLVGALIVTVMNAILSVNELAFK
jgi:general secretion pathway protein F